MKKIKAYLSHAIRGAKREHATKNEIVTNCQEALTIGNRIREHIPELILWVPAEHEDFVFEAYERSILSEDQILEIDCAIISKRDLLIIFVKNNLYSNGMNTEINHSEKENISIIRIHVGDDLQIKLSDLERLKRIVSDLLEEKKNEN